MQNLDGNMIVAVIALVINLITIIKFTNALERRLTTLETTIEQGILPNVKRLDDSLLRLVNRKRVERTRD
jgi:hypothetical protein